MHAKRRERTFGYETTNCGKHSVSRWLNMNGSQINKMADVLSVAPTSQGEGGCCT